LELSESQKASINVLRTCWWEKFNHRLRHLPGKRMDGYFGHYRNSVVAGDARSPYHGFTITGQQALFSPGVVAMRKTIVDLQKTHLS
jgi:hypothetical protein